MRRSERGERRVPQFCIVFRGPAGAGKSTLAETVQRELSQKVAAIDTDIFNWRIVPGEDDKEVVYENVVTLAANYLRRGYSVVIEGLIITSEEMGAISTLRELATAGGATFLDFYCHVPRRIALRRNRGRDRGVSDQMIEEWWDLAEADKKNVQWPLVELDMTVDRQRCAAQVLGYLGSQGGAERAQRT